METTKKSDLFINKTGVKTSIIVTIFSTIMLFIALNSDKNNSEMLEFLALFTIIIEFVYSVIVTYCILRYKKKHIYLLSFLFLNWFIGCFSTNVFINQGSPILSSITSINTLYLSNNVNLVINPSYHLTILH